MSDDRGRCAMCDGSLDGHRADARFCGPACRREAARYRRVLAGVGDGPYRTIPQLLNRAQRRAKPAPASREAA
jgi:hypothetical protein